MSNFYTCTYCGKSIEISHKDIHENYCLYVPKNEEFNDLIPCEICNNYINFSEYGEHVENCGDNNLKAIPYDTWQWPFKIKSGGKETIVNAEVRAARFPYGLAERPMNNPPP